MRWLLRTLLFWAITLPLFYLFGLPLLMEKLQAKAQVETYNQCQSQLLASNMTGSPTAILKQPAADHYCHCVSEGLTLQQSDLPDLVQHKQPPRLDQQMKTVVDACNVTLQQSMKQTMDSGPQPYSTKDANGVETVYFR